MSDPTILYCVGATKAGTSWLYRYLHDHADCRMPAVKEAHYWDTFEAEPLAKQLGAYRRRLRELRALKVEASDAGRAWQVQNVERRIGDMKGLMQALQAERAGDSAYRAWLTEARGQARVFGDMTPNYALLPDEMIARMVALSPHTKVIFLIRDPLDRLWSHVRMQAKRQRQAHEIYEKKANNILYRILNRGQETHILERGDYLTIIAKLRRLVPRDRLLIQFTEDMYGPTGIADICAFLDIVPSAATPEGPIHPGQDVVMLEKLRPRVQALLSDQYEWVAEHVGPLPPRWQENKARAAA